MFHRFIKATLKRDDTPVRVAMNRKDRGTCMERELFQKDDRITPNPFGLRG